MEGDANDLCYRTLSFIRSVNSFRPFYSASSIPPLLMQKRSRHSTDTVPEFHAEAPQATASEGLRKGPYVAARAGFEPTTLRTMGVESTNAPLHTSR